MPSSLRLLCQSVTEKEEVGQTERPEENEEGKKVLDLVRAFVIQHSTLSDLLFDFTKNIVFDPACERPTEGK